MRKYSLQWLWLCLSMTLVNSSSKTHQNFYLILKTTIHCDYENFNKNPNIMNKTQGVKHNAL